MKYKFIVLLTLIIFITLDSYAAVENYNEVNNLWIDIDVNSEIKVSQITEAGKLENIVTELTLYPINDNRQTIKSLKIISEPQADITEEENKVVYKWGNMNDNYQFGFESSIETKNFIYPIPSTPFPILSIDPSLRSYLEPTDNIDINDDILVKATSIAQDKENLIEVVFGVADWVNQNINYDLNSLTAAAVQKSSWVLANRQGVCDEITSLFISMLRSIGVPARFVSGMVYTNLDYSFGNHGWAEVYFEGYGWIPFDVTFGQYGWIDPSHVKLSDSVDSATYSAKYKWRSYGLKIEPQDLKLASSVISAGDKRKSPYNLDASLIEDEVGPGSYVPLRISVENPFDYYVSTSLIITKAPQLTEKNVKQVLIKPKSRTDVFWLIKVPDNIDSDYLYTSDIEVKESFGARATTSLDYSASYKVVQLKESEDIIQSYTKISKKTFSEFISMKCASDKKYYFKYELGSISCIIKNKTDDKLNADICVLDSCKKLNLASQEDSMVNFDINFNQLNSQTIIITANVQGKNVNDFVNLKIYDKPILHIDNIEYPELINYDDQIELSFHLSSSPAVSNVEIEINDFGYSKIDSLSETQKVILPLKGNILINNNIKLAVSYLDENGKEYLTTFEYPINVVGVPWYARLFEMLRQVFT